MGEEENEKALCICSICGALVYFKGSTFFKEKRKQKKSKEKLKIINIVNTKWKYMDIFDEIKQKSQEYDFVSFPFCPSCCSNQINQIKISTKIMQKTISSLNELPLSNIETFLLQIKQDNETIPKQQQIHYQTSREQSTFFFDPSIIPSLDIDPIEQDQSKDIKIPNFGFSLFLTFRISTNRHYITINNCRIGFYQYSKNSIDENNSGLCFVSHLIFSFLSKFDIQTKNFKINPNGEITIQNKKIKFNVPIKIIGENLAEFNEANLRIFEASFLIFDSANLISEIGTCIPFMINIEKKTIANTSFVFDPPKADIWSKAMKLLLFDFKMIQMVLTGRSNA